MDEVDESVFDSLRTEFVLTRYWRPSRDALDRNELQFGREVQLIEEGPDGSANLVPFGFVVGGNEPDVDPQYDPRPNEPTSFVWASVSNGPEVTRAWKELQTLRTATQNVPAATETEKRIRFLEEVLNLFARWYARNGFVFPLQADKAEAEQTPAGTGNRIGYQIAKDAFEFIDRAESVSELYRLMGGKEGKERGFRLHLERLGFYPTGRSMSRPEKYEALRRRIRAFAEQGIRPPLPIKPEKSTRSRK